MSHNFLCFNRGLLLHSVFITIAVARCIPLLCTRSRLKRFDARHTNQIIYVSQIFKWVSLARCYNSDGSAHNRQKMLQAKLWKKNEIGIGSVVRIFWRALFDQFDMRWKVKCCTVIVVICFSLVFGFEHCVACKMRLSLTLCAPNLMPLHAIRSISAFNWANMNFKWDHLSVLHSLKISNKKEWRKEKKTLSKRFVFSLVRNQETSFCLWNSLLYI